MCAFGEGACSACDWLGIACIPMGKLSQPPPNWHQRVMKTSFFAHNKWARLEDRPLMGFRNSQRMQGNSGCSGPALVLVWGFNQSNTKLLFLGEKQIPWDTDQDTLSPGHTWSAPAVLTLIYFYSFFNHYYYFKTKPGMGWRDDAAVEITHCCSRGLRFHFHHKYLQFQFQGIQYFFSGPSGHQASTWSIDKNTHTRKK